MIRSSFGLHYYSRTRRNLFCLNAKGKKIKKEVEIGPWERKQENVSQRYPFHSGLLSAYVLFPASQIARQLSNKSKQILSFTPPIARCVCLCVTERNSIAIVCWETSPHPSEFALPPIVRAICLLQNTDPITFLEGQVALTLPTKVVQRGNEMSLGS